MKEDDKNTISVITIDGPTASGKGTVGRFLAAKLKWRFLDSGLLYRALAYAHLKYPGTDLDNFFALKDLISLIAIDFPPIQDIHPHGESVFFEGVEISSELRREGLGKKTSEISKNPNVRAVLLDWQREFRKFPGLIADGRDMGTVVFPDAGLKIFLTASAESRAYRRYEQLKEKGFDVSLAEVFNDLIARDERDSKRKISPLKPAEDAVVIDATDLDVDGVLQEIMKAIGASALI